MGEKFKDFPCLYYLDSRVNRKSRIQFYSMLASMFGQTPEQAAQNSELFAHASGKLFGGTGYTLEEIRTNAGNYFEKPYKDCRGFYRRKAYSEANLKDNCCMICLYCNEYRNACLEQERQILRILIEHRDMLGFLDCSAADFKSKLAISCSNDLSEYPIISFNAYLFEYLVRNGELAEDDVVAFVKSIMIENGLFVPEEALSSFISTQIGIISRVNLPGGDHTSALIYAIDSIRASRYVPPQLVHSVSESKNKDKKSEISDAPSSLARLFEDCEGIQYISKMPKVAPVENPSCSSDECGPHDLSQSSASSSANLRPSLMALFGGASDRQEDDISPVNDVQETDAVEEACDLSQDECRSYDNKVPDEVSIPLTEDIGEGTADESVYGESMEQTDSFNTEYEESTNAAELSDGDEVEDLSVNDDLETVGVSPDVSVVTITPLPDNVYDDMTAEQIESITYESDDLSGDELSLLKTDTMSMCDSETSVAGPCCICGGVAPEKYPYTEDWVRGLYRHCIACENAVAKGNEKPFFSSALNHPVIAMGCAFSNNEPEYDCIYSDVPVPISDEFASIVNDCSDYACELSNLVSFIEACDNASYASVECVKMYGIDGLLFYVTGSYYFIGGGTTACAALKKLLSNADRLRLFSINPLLVHVKMLRFGLRRVKVESLAVKYSVFVGTDLLLPPSVMFVAGDGTDVYRIIMPQYERLFERTLLTADEGKQYEKLKRLEWALAASVDTSFIALGENRSVYGSNALNYRFALLDVGQICREGTLYVVTLDDGSKIPPEEERLFWEDVAGRLASSSLSCMNYSFILGLGKGISYFACFEEEAFFDSLMASARSAYKKAYKREVHLQVTREKYVTN